MTSQGIGFLDPSGTNSEFNAHWFVLNQRLARVRTMTIVQVQAVNGGGLGSPPTVNVQPLISMVDGGGNATPHGTIFSIPVWRMQGGGNAVICDPVVGDIGWMAISDRDMSSVIANKAVAAPGSGRIHDLADGVYMGALVGSTPQQYIQFNTNGLSIVDTNGNKITTTSSGVSIIDKSGNKIVTSSGGVAITGNVSITGVLTTTGNVTAGSIDLETHVHTGTQPGTGTSGPPVG